MSDDPIPAGTSGMPVARGNLNTHRPGHIPARILWPALGFPAVIAPGSPSDPRDVTNSISVLIMSKKRKISSKQAAAHLRVVPWKQRHARNAAAESENAFPEAEIEVESGSDSSFDPTALRILRLGATNDSTQVVDFGWGGHSKKWITAGLSRFVIKFYTKLNYDYLHEIHVSKAASAKLAPQLYNLFWINSNPNDTENDISDELRLLIDEHAKPTREKLPDAFISRFEDDPTVAAQVNSFLLKEYEYDYGALHAPYNHGKPQPDIAANRTEVLHPLFVWEKGPEDLQIGHITDLHVDVRADVYEDNLKKAGFSVFLKNTDYKIDYNNWNKSATDSYGAAKKGSNIVLATGDLIDYGRGHWGLPQGEELGDDAMYHHDRNWFLFYYLFASGQSYDTPMYTILGNHDWRLNPYSPFAVAGAPNAESLIHNHEELRQKTKTHEDWREVMNQALRLAHGPGYERKFSYYIDAKSEWELLEKNPKDFWETFAQILKHTKTMNVKHSPAETTVESIAWYLLLINPFLDYRFHLPGGFDVLMLDWAEYEDVLFPSVEHGEESDYLPWQAGAASYGGPRAKSCVTELQKGLVEDFLAKPGRAKIIGIHAPPIGPYPDWTDDTLAAGEIRIDHDEKVRGLEYIERIEPFPGGTSETWYGHQFFAIRPKDGMFGQAADYGSFQTNREWLIRRLYRDDAHVPLVVSGHIHRNSLLVVRPREGGTHGAMLIGRTTPTATPHWRKWEIAMDGDLLLKRIEPEAAFFALYHLPLYVNTTSAGPRGNYFPQFPVRGSRTAVDPGFAKIVLANDGTIRSVEFLGK